MFKTIPRGIVYHKLKFDINNLFRSIVTNHYRDMTQVDKFEKEFAQYFNVNHSIAFPYARTALYYILKSKNLPKGTEIIMPPITIKPMMDVVLNLGLKPVFVDLDMETLCFKKDDLEKKINNNTKVIFITYLFGIVPNVEELMEISRKNNLYIIEDFSHNINSTFNQKKLGSFGDVGIYSSSSIKTYDIYGGGLVITDDNDLYKALSDYKRTMNKAPKGFLVSKILLDLLRNLFTQRLVFALFTFPLLNFLTKKIPSFSKKLTGARLNLKPLDELPNDWFYEFSSFQAEIAHDMRSDLEYNDHKRISNVEYLKKELANYPVLFPGIQDKPVQNVYWQCMIFVDNPTEFKAFLSDNHIDNSSTNLTLISELDIYGDYKKDLENAKKIKYEGIFIPVYSSLTKVDLERIVSTIKNYFQKEI